MQSRVKQIHTHILYSGILSQGRAEPAVAVQYLCLHVVCDVHTYVTRVTRMQSTTHERGHDSLTPESTLLTRESESESTT
jgi:hypothetical protein